MLRDELSTPSNALFTTENRSHNLAKAPSSYTEKGYLPTSPCDRVHSATELGVRWIQVPA